MKIISYTSNGNPIGNIYDVVGTLAVSFGENKTETLEDIELCSLYNFLVCSCNSASFSCERFRLSDYQMPTLFSLIKKDAQTVEFIREAFDSMLDTDVVRSYDVSFSDVLRFAEQLKELLIEQLQQKYEEKDIESLIERYLEDILPL